MDSPNKFDISTPQDIIDDLKDINEDLTETLEYLHSRFYQSETTNKIVAAKALIKSVIEDIENKQ